MPKRNWSQKEIENVLIRLGAATRTKDGQFINGACVLGVGKEKYHIYVYKFRMSTLRKEFKTAGNIELHKSKMLVIKS